MKDLVIKLPDQTDINMGIEKKVNEMFVKMKNEIKEMQEQILSRPKAAEFLGVSPPTLDKYTENGDIIGYRLGGRPVYKRSELLNALKQIETIKYKRR